MVPMAVPKVLPALSPAHQITTAVIEQFISLVHLILCVWLLPEVFSTPKLLKPAVSVTTDSILALT